MPKREILLFIDDIYDSCRKILSYMEGYDYKKFKSDFRTIDAVVRNLEIIGEATRNLSTEFKRQHSEIPWKDICSMRNKVAHEYFGVDDKILWATTEEDIPYLLAKVAKIKKDLREQSLF